MNAKKAKLIRKGLKLSGVDVRQFRYEEVDHTRRVKTIKDIKGEVTHTFTTVSKKLTDFCGRALYKQAKSA